MAGVSVVLPTPSEPGEWIVCMIIAIIVVVSVYMLLHPLPLRGRTHVVDMSGTAPPMVEMEPPRRPLVSGSPSNSPARLSLRGLSGRVTPDDDSGPQTKQPD